MSDNGMTPRMTGLEMLETKRDIINNDINQFKGWIQLHWDASKSFTKKIAEQKKNIKDLKKQRKLSSSLRAGFRKAIAKQKKDLAPIELEIEYQKGLKQ